MAPNERGSSRNSNRMRTLSSTSNSSRTSNRSNNDNHEDTKPDPKNLFVQVRDMADVSFLIFSFAYIIKAAKVLAKKNSRNNSSQNNDENDMYQQLSHLQHYLDPYGKVVEPTASTKRNSKNNNRTKTKIPKTAMLNQTFLTPGVMLKILRQHKTEIEQLQKQGKVPKNLNVDAVIQSIENIQKRVPSNVRTQKKEPLTLMQYDDVFQKSEIVYAIGKDDVNKRITVIFRGSESSKLLGSGKHNWSTNFTVWKQKIPNRHQKELPAKFQEVKTNNDVKQFWIHSGFYNALMVRKTKTNTDAPSTTKYQQIVQKVRQCIQDHPGYQIYVTGHSLGGALSTVFAFFLAGEANDVIPYSSKPVVNISFGSPRVGDHNFLKACQILERRNHLQILRVVNDKDSVTVMPTYQYYHVGFQLKLPRPANTKNSTNEKKKKTEEGPIALTYPKLKDSTWNKLGRAWNNSTFASFNLAYDHGDYRDRILLQKAALQALPCLKQLYRTGHRQQSAHDMLGFYVVAGK